MAACAVPEFASRLKWRKAMVREAIHDGRSCVGSSVKRGLKGSLPFIRFLRNFNGIGSLRVNSTREKRRISRIDDAPEHLQSRTSVREAVARLTDCVNQGNALDSYDYLDVLRECSKHKDLESVKQVHNCVKQSGLEQNSYVANSLLKCYIVCGRLQNAKEIFNKSMNKTVVGWNTMIGGYAEHDQAENAIEVYRQFRDEGGEPNAITYLSALKACASPGALNWGKEIHADIIQDGFPVDVRVCTALVTMYAKCGSVDNARRLFDKMEKRDMISWNAMIGVLAQHGLVDEAFSLFLQMQREGFTPDSYTLVNILNFPSGTGGLEWVAKIHVHAIKADLDVELRVGNALVHMYAKCGSIAEARKVFFKMRKRDVVSWNVMIGGLAQHGYGHEAYCLFLQMQSEGFTPDSVTCLNILTPSSSADSLEWVKGVHAHVVKAGLDADLRVANALVHMYSKSGSIEDSRLVFDRMGERDVVSWNVMIGGLAQHGLGHEAFSLFLQMQREGFKPNSLTYVNILNHYSSTGALEWVKEVHAHAMKADFDVDLRVENALIHMYAKIGSIADARQVFDNMQNQDVVSWTVMIGGLAQHGHGREALQLFKEMKSMGVKPTGLLFLAVLSACSHAGLVDEGRFQFVSMTQDYGIEPDAEHHNCMVDILGRAGHLVEAKHIILNMPIQPNVVTWKALLGACRVYESVELAELAAKECWRLEPMDPSPYVTLSNIYAAAGNWDQVSLIRNRMQEIGIRKDPGRCWIEVDKKNHQFVVRDHSHPEMEKIKSVLDGLYESLKREGYIPDTRLVVRNISEEDKESALCSHSERLAIAYGLMHVTPGKPIRIYKNLRICTDCHTVTKLTSKVTGREIVARDAHRFHLFKDGLCSCGDYW